METRLDELITRCDEAVRAVRNTKNALEECARRLGRYHKMLKKD